MNEKLINDITLLVSINYWAGVLFFGIGLIADMLYSIVIGCACWFLVAAILVSLAINNK